MVHKNGARPLRLKWLLFRIFTLESPNANCLVLTVAWLLRRKSIVWGSQKQRPLIPASHLTMNSQAELATCLFK